MNDCLWYYIGICPEGEGICDGSAIGCKYYLDVNSKGSDRIIEQYQKDINWVVEPVREKYREKYLK